MTHSGSSQPTPPPYPAMQYPAPQYPAQAYPVPQLLARGPLLPRQKRGAIIAGAVGFSILEIGLGCIVVPLTVAVVALILTSLLGAVAYVAGGSSAWESVWSGLSSILPSEPTVLVAMAVGLIVLGIVVSVAGILTSGWILKGHQVNRPNAVTWSSIGIALVAQSVVGGIFSFSGELVWAFIPDLDTGVAVVLGILAGLLGIATAGVAGAFIWWWMAHVFRAGPPAATRP